MLTTSERQKSFRGFFYLIPFLFLFFTPSIYADFDSGLNNEQREEKQQELELLRQRMSDLRQKIEKQQAEKKLRNKIFKRHRSTYWRTYLCTEEN